MQRKDSGLYHLSWFKAALRFESCLDSQLLYASEYQMPSQNCRFNNTVDFLFDVCVRANLNEWYFWIQGQCAWPNRRQSSWSRPAPSYCSADLEPEVSLCCTMPANSEMLFEMTSKLRWEQHIEILLRLKVPVAGIMLWGKRECLQWWRGLPLSRPFKLLACGGFALLRG